jgi:hypothetical protein
MCAPHDSCMLSGASWSDLEREEPAFGQMFRADVDEVVLTRLTDAGDRLPVQIWKPGVPLRRIEPD